MKIKLNTVVVAWIILLLLQVAILSGCDLYENWRNGEPTINSLDVPQQVEYGETVEFKVSVFDPEDDNLTYLWHVSDGTLKKDTEPIVQWIAPR